MEYDLKSLKDVKNILLDYAVLYKKNRYEGDIWELLEEIADRINEEK